MYSPPTLLQLALQSLLRDKDLATAALRDLPEGLFPPLFMQAFTRAHTEVLKAMVMSWPFPCLPLGALMNWKKSETSQIQLDIAQLQERKLQIIQAVLDGLDVLLAQKASPR